MILSQDGNCDGSPFYSSEEHKPLIDMSLSGSEAASYTADNTVDSGSVKKSKSQKHVRFSRSGTEHHSEGAREDQTPRKTYDVGCTWS